MTCINMKLSDHLEDTWLWSWSLEPYKEILLINYGGNTVMIAQAY